MTLQLHQSLMFSAFAGIANLLVGQNPGKLGTGAYVELAIRLAQMPLDRLLRHEQRLGDLPVRRPVGSHPGHPSFACGKRVEAAEERSPGPGTRRQQLRARTLGQCRRATSLRELEGSPKGISRA